MNSKTTRLDNVFLTNNKRMGGKWDLQGNYIGLA